MKTMHFSARRPMQQRGALLIEALVSILICAFALLGFVAMQARATTSEFESYQRSQALVLLDDMVDRLNTNRANADSYVTAGLIGEGAVVDCAGTAGAARDLCEWGNLIRGSAETRGTSKVGSMLSARGCITRPADSSKRYIVSIVWLGNVPTGAPTSSCGKADAAFPNEALRRVVSSSVCVGLLSNTAAPAALPRC
jgi:type IV pilus assembly protein PilV